MSDSTTGTAARVTVTLADGVADVPIRSQPALAMAKQIAGRSPHAVQAAERLLNLAGHADLASGFAAEQQEIRALIGSPNQVEAVTARFEKRDPTFAEV
jgi:enoyl-CoA hydratase/carnithine racemase